MGEPHKALNPLGRWEPSRIQTLQGALLNEMVKLLQAALAHNPQKAAVKLVRISQDTPWNIKTAFKQEVYQKNPVREDEAGLGCASGPYMAPYMAPRPAPAPSLPRAAPRSRPRAPQCGVRGMARMADPYLRFA